MPNFHTFQMEKEAHMLCKFRLKETNVKLFHKILELTSDSRLLDFELLDFSSLFFQLPGLPGGLKFSLFEDFGTCM